MPLLAVAPFLGSAGLAVAATLILLERTGKAIRSPSKSALLARVATATGRGKGFAVHKALDQIGAFAGPLLLAGMAALTGVFWPGFAILAVPGALSLLLLAWLRRRALILLEPEQETATPSPGQQASSGGRLGAAFGVDLPGAFHLFSLAPALMTAGLMTFGVISFRLIEDGLLVAAAVPLVYAGAMAVEALAALGTGGPFDRWGGRVLLVVPALVALVPLAVFADRLWVVLVGGGLAGALMEEHVPTLATVIVSAQVVATGLLLLVSRRTREAADQLEERASMR